MNRYLFTAAFALGLLALLWVGAGFVGTSAMALLMTAAMAGVYGLGAWELARFRAATVGLGNTLAAIARPVDTPHDLSTWLTSVPPTLQHTVRLRIEGERTGLPGPGLTPYLVGLLVMLGMLGTFLGMVVTFKGAVFALEGSADMQAIRSALAAPIKGLGLAFGTSVAGVAASAMLGLMSAVARRERAEAGRALDACAATVFRPFSLVHQRQETFKALQAQSLAMPRVVDSLKTLVDGLERRSQQLNTQLLDQQAQFHRDATQAYTGLADRVGQTLHTSLAANAQAAGDALQRTVQAAMAEMVQASAQAHQRQMDTTQTQLAGVVTQFGATAQAVSTAWQQVQQSQASTQQALVDSLAQAQAARADADTRHEQRHTERLAQLTTLSRTELAALRQNEADVLTQLRQEMARLAERDNRALAERTELVGQLNALLQGMGHTATEQRAAITTLVASAQAALDQAHTRFADALGAQAGHAERVATHVSASAVELASVGEAFGHGMGLFSATHDKLTDGLARLEATLQQAIARSDEQLAYYVAQAREVIDLSIAAQQGVVEDLRRLQTPGRAV